MMLFVSLVKTARLCMLLRFKMDNVTTKQIQTKIKLSLCKLLSSVGTRSYTLRLLFFSQTMAHISTRLSPRTFTSLQTIQFRLA